MPQMAPFASTMGTRQNAMPGHQLGAFLQCGIVAERQAVPSPTFDRNVLCSTAHGPVQHDIASVVRASRSHLIIRDRDLAGILLQHQPGGMGQRTPAEHTRGRGVMML